MKRTREGRREREKGGGESYQAKTTSHPRPGSRRSRGNPFNIIFNLALNRLAVSASRVEKLALASLKPLSLSLCLHSRRDQEEGNGVCLEIFPASILASYTISSRKFYLRKMRRFGLVRARRRVESLVGQGYYGRASKSTREREKKREKKEKKDGSIDQAWMETSCTYFDSWPASRA